MTSAPPSIWSVLLPVIIGAALASVVPIALALLHRRWALADEARRETRRLSEARREERKSALNEYLRARAACCTAIGDFHYGRLTEVDDEALERLVTVADAAEAHYLTVHTPMRLYWTSEQYKVITDDVDRMRSWSEAIEREDVKQPDPELQSFPRIIKGFKGLLDAP